MTNESNAQREVRPGCDLLYDLLTPYAGTLRTIAFTKFGTPVPALAQEREDISAFSNLKKDPFSHMVRLKNTPISIKTLPLTFGAQN